MEGSHDPSLLPDQLHRSWQVSSASPARWQMAVIDKRAVAS